MIEIVDSHHHIWRQADLPWLTGPMVPRIFGPYEAIRRDYPIEEFRADLEPGGVVASVYCQTNWGPGKALDEVTWVESVAAATGWPQAIVGYVDMLAGDAETVIDAQRAASRRYVGARMQLHWHENPQYRFAASPDIVRRPELKHSLDALGERGLTFDLQVFPGQMADAAALVARCPKVTFVLLHAGMLEDTSPQGRALWREGMRRLADLPNVTVKLSGLGTFIHRVDAAHIAEVALPTVELFGADRCMFGTNFPIEKLWSTGPELIGAWRAALGSLPEDDQRAIFSGTARRVYRVAA